MRVLIIGGTGFLGAALRDRLLGLGVWTSTVARSPSQVTHEKLKHITADLSEIPVIEKEIMKSDVVFHFAYTSTPAQAERNWSAEIYANLLPVTRIIELCANTGCKLIFSSSGGTVYGNPLVVPTPETAEPRPLSVYGLTKLMTEEALRFGYDRYQVPTTVLRISNPFGLNQTGEKGQGVIGRFLRSVIKDQSVEIWGDGSIVRDYIHIDDVVEALLLAAEVCESFEVYNVGSSIGRSLTEIVSVIEQVAGRSVNKEYREHRTIDIPVNILDITKIKEKMNWRPDLDFKKQIESIYRQLLFESRKDAM